MKLPTEYRPRAEIPPAHARVLLAGAAKSGKSTLAAAWLPKTTLILDTQGGTTLLDGDHYVIPVETWTDFVDVVDELEKDPQHFQTVVIDLVNDLWRFCDVHFAGKNGETAASTDDFQRSIRTAHAVFQQTIGRLISLDLGLWMLTHTREVPEKNAIRHKVSMPDKNVHEYLVGIVQYVWVIERIGREPVLTTQPSARFEAGSRTPLPAEMPCDAKAIWVALDKGLNPSKYDEAGKLIRPVATTTETAVAA